ncbi:MAG: glycolate oxidase subunit GlcE [Rhizobiales bacterium]|nr:glycolate oxidase subunit GlcE [Hyphomicrobiales bacterium]MBI3672346.1 glycolate oxidase subunit GlcE [Hyphomicrobiales bacterium]
MGEVLQPATNVELATLIREAAVPLEVMGAGSKRGLGRPVAASAVLDLSRFTGIGLYEPEELVLAAGAATPMAEIEVALAAHNQQLAFEPPDLSRLFGSRHAGTLGGVLAGNLSGPRRIKAGAARDHILGLTGVSGRGDVIRAGARVVKNVTGYDIPKLMAGSYGTLMAFTSVTFKVLPRPETEETLVLGGLDDGAAVEAMSLALQSPCDVSAAAHVPGEGTFLRLEGIAPSVAYRREKLKALLGGDIGLLDAEQSARRWKAIGDVAMFADRPERPVWRLSLTPSEAPVIVAKIHAEADIRHFYDWGGGLVWLDVPPTEDASASVIRNAFASGHATLFRASAEIRSRVAVFQPQAPALAALSARVKASFDPKGLLNPGRMYEGV